ncbi:MAG: DUF6449 domain-containing protein [Lachnospiraceae bacterium]|nr:DUF6449 domain-containing protein [Lachnospiraceae bacterium]
MTSENLSSTKTSRRSSLQIELTRQRLWQLVIIAIIDFVYYVGATYTAIIEYKERIVSSDPLKLSNIIELLAKVYGVNTPMGLIWAGIAVCAAVLGYGWLNNRQQLDFYEALPVKRGVRWRAVFINGILLMFIPQLVFMSFGLLLALSFGCMTQFLLVQAIYGILRVFVMEASVYSVAVFAAMLCGNLVIAFLGSSVLLIVEANLRFVFKAYETFSYKTYYRADSTDDAFYTLSPLVNFMAGIFDKGLNVRRDLINLGVLVVMTAAAYALYKIRKNEMAGTAIVFPAARDIISVVLNVVYTLTFSMFFAGSFAEQRNFGVTVFLIIVTLVSSLIVAVSINMILYMNVRSMFKKPVLMIIGAAVSVIVVLTFRYDLTGYDRYLPNPKSVESCAFFVDNNMNYYTDTGDGGLAYTDSENYAEKYMKLTNIEAVEKIVKIGEKCITSGENASDSYSLKVLFRLKNGRKVYRQLEVPKDVDKETMDAVFGTKEFREGYFPIYHSEAFEKQYPKNPSITYSSYVYDKKIEGESAVDNFKAAYEKDLEKFSYSTVVESNVIGAVTYTRNSVARTSDGDEFEYGQDMTFTIYDSFTNTIDYLKKNSIWIDTEIDASHVKEIIVTNNSEYDDDGEVKTVSYTDKEKIKKILESVHDNNISATWESTDDEESDYLAEVIFNDDAPENAQLESNGTFYTLFNKGALPDFVAKDFD